jgi:hypothetical protein
VFFGYDHDDLTTFSVSKKIDADRFIEHRTTIFKIIRHRHCLANKAFFDFIDYKKPDLSSLGSVDRIIDSLFVCIAVSFLDQ